MAETEQPPESVLDTLDEAPPLGLFTRLSRVGLHLAQLQNGVSADLGLPYSDFTILNTLRRYGEQGGLPVLKLGRLVMRPPGSMTLILDRLAKADLIERRAIPEDRRSVLIALTPTGEEVARRGAETYDALQQRVLAGVGESEVADIDQAVRRLLEILEDASEDPA